MKLFNCHAEFISASHDSELPSSADKVTSFAKGSTVPFVKQVRNDKKTYLSSGREKNFNAKTCLSIRNLREGNNNNCTDALSVCKADISPKGGDRKRAAFTLAEVLITLTIIGVIAAITIPNLMQSWKKHQVEVGVKEAYSILSNVIKMSEQENVPISEWLPEQTPNYDTKVQLVQKYYAPYLKYSKIGNPYKSGDLGGNNNSSNFFKPNGQTSCGSPGSYVIFNLNNGMLLGIVPENYYGRKVYYFADINGRKKPNKCGADVFFFTSHPNYRTLITGRPGSFSEADNYRYIGTPFLPNNHINVYCLNTGADGTACSALLQKNNWKIPDNYPIKKF